MPGEVYDRVVSEDRNERRYLTGRIVALEAQLDAAIDRVMARTLPEYDARRPIPDIDRDPIQPDNGRYLQDPTGLYEAFVPDESPSVVSAARAKWERFSEDDA